MSHFSLTPAEAVGKLLTLADAEGFAALAKQLNVGEPTLRDIAAELSRPGRDPRDELPQVLMRSDVMDLKDLQPGMELRGTVRNVTDFGADGAAPRESSERSRPSRRHRDRVGAGSGCENEQN